jgi:hypothetical protein
MSINKDIITYPNDRTYTGLLGYERKFEYLGGGTLPYRALETYSYEVVDTAFTNLGNLDPYFSLRFSELLGVFSGDINVSSLDIPNSNNISEDLIRFQKHKLKVEVRTDANFNTAAEYLDERNQGLSSVLGYHKVLEDFSDSFSFGLSENGDKNYSHDISFVLKTGSHSTFDVTRETATQIALDLLDDSPTDLSHAAFDAYGNFVSSGSTKIYYNETFDVFRNSFSFSKKKSILPSNSGSWNHELSHSVNYTENGVFNVDEKIKVVGSQEYVDAEVGFEELLAGSQGRCEGIFSNYFALAELQYSDATVSNNSSLVRTKTSKTYNIPSLTIEGSLSYTNDEAKLIGLSRDESFEASRAQNGVFSLNHSVRYGIYNHLSGDLDAQTVSGTQDILGVMSVDRENSFTAARRIFGTFTGLTPMSSGITRTKTNVKSQDRAKDYSIQMSYSNDPVYDVEKFVDPYTSTAINGFNMMSVDLSDQRPPDIINEYTVINRPEQTNILSYGYQQEPARASVSFKGNIPRDGDNFSTPLSYLTTETQQLLRYGHSIFLDGTLLNSDIYNYFLSDIKYNFNSKNDFGMTLEFSYTKKKYGDIS